MYSRDWSSDVCSSDLTHLLRLVNRVSLDRILQSEVYVNEADDQLRAAQLILRYTPISRALQAPRCVIRAKDPQLHHINIAYEGFVVPKGILLPKHMPSTKSLPFATLSTRVSSSSPVLQEEEEGKEEEGEQGFVNLTEFVDEFEVFNQPPSPKSLPEEMGIPKKAPKEPVGVNREPTRKWGAWEVCSTQAPTSSAEVPTLCSSTNPSL